MKKLTIFLSILGFSLVIASAATVNPEPSGNSYITGVVYSSSSRQPVPSVWVIVSQSDNVKGQSLTGDNGRYYIARLEDGVFDIIVRKNRKVVFTGRVQLPKDSIYNIRLP